MSVNPSSKDTDDSVENQVHSPDDVIHELGGCGRFQVRMAVLVHVIKTICNWCFNSMVFITLAPDWRCIDEMSVNTSQANNVSFDNACYTRNGSRCTSFEFDGTKRTIVSEWDLVCDRAWIPSTIVTISLVVNVIGYVFAGHLADTFGRKIPFFFSVFLMMAFSLVSYFSVNWIMFAAARVMIGIGNSFFLTIQYSYLSEFTLSRWRSWFIGFPSWPIQACFLALILWLLKDWQNVQLVIAAIGVPFMAAWWLMPESFRWYYGHDRVEEAEKVITTVSKVNRRQIPDMTYMKRLAMTSMEAKQSDRKYSILDLFSSRLLIKVTFLMLIVWFTIGLVETGMLFGIQNLPGNFYLHLFLFKVVQVPSKSLGIWLQNRVGRRITSILVYFVTGVSALLVGIVQYIDTDKRDALTTGFALAANLSVAVAWGPLQTITVELYPTVIRNIGFSFCAILSQVGAAVAPQLVHWDTAIPGIMYFICGGLSVLGGCAFFGVPETNNEKLSDKLNVHIVIERNTDDSNVQKNGPMPSEEPSQETDKAIAILSNGIVNSTL